MGVEVDFEFDEVFGRCSGERSQGDVSLSVRKVFIVGALAMV